MLVLLIIPILMGATFRMVGAGWLETKTGKSWMKWVANVMAVFPIAGVAALGYGHDWLFPIFLVWCAVWFETGHKDPLSWGRPSPSPVRDNTLTPIALFIAGGFGWHRTGIQYARLFMAIKGFLFTLPIGGGGAIAYPLGYEVGEKVLRDFSRDRLGDPDTIREILAGVFIGIAVCLFYIGISVM